ncbi:MAG: hypothetical protein COV76_06765 [Candidatus Omnitrophica bacterium CG11_big_fil_rev_8_21_14_0_20_64_10]|nr:MAG: hypothetical protein COV76_06765 [Candidatus Omnitrophica bacterium CG11_big_fil_rev_8_21_14_0_20_64_10]
MAETSVLDQLKALTRLQELDGQIYALKETIRTLPEEKQTIEAERAEGLKIVQAVEQKHKELEVKRNGLETDLEAKEGQIKKLQGQLFQVKTNKEYTAMQREIEGLKADKSVVEEDVLGLMEKGESGKSEVEAARKAHQSREAQWNQALQVVETRLKETTAQVEVLQKQRDGLLSDVEPRVLAQYERILERKQGLALVPVISESCGGCYMRIPPQRVNEIQMGSRLITCESCARILYYPTA